MEEEYLYERISSRENVEYAVAHQISVLKSKVRIRYKKYEQKYIQKALHIFETQEWDIKYREPFIIKEKGKEREIVTCSFLDKAIQKAMLIHLEPIIVRHFINDTYQSITGRGLHKAVTKLKKIIRNAKRLDIDNVHYLQLDIKKYYPSIDVDILMRNLRELIWCDKTLKMLEIHLGGDKETNYGKGVTIGGVLSQLLGNTYLYKLDHRLTKINGVKYLRYADDMVFISNNKDKLRKINNIFAWCIGKTYKLKISRVKWGRITETNPIDTLGYKFFINRVAVRKDIKHNLSKAWHRCKFESFASLLGHCKWGHSKKMINNIMKSERSPEVSLEKVREFNQRVRNMRQNQQRRHIAKLNKLKVERETKSLVKKRKPLNRFNDW